MKRTALPPLIITLALLVAACGGAASDEEAPPTATLAPIVSQTPRLTATPLSSFTPRPTFTPTPTETPIPPTPSNTIPPTATPPITGIIASLETVNVRNGPGLEYSAFEALVPGTGVTVLGQNSLGTWYEVELADLTRGWVAAQLVRLNPTPTPIPTLTPSPDLTALALGTPLPTAIIGGGTITPTPPGSAVSPTPPGDGSPAAVAAAATTNPNVTPTATESFLPVRDIDTLNQTATALAAAVEGLPTGDPNAPATATGRSPNVPASATPTTTDSAAPTSASSGATGTTPTTTTTTGPTQATAAPSGGGRVQQGVDVFALCNNTALGPAAPTDIGAGSTIDIYWAWFVSDEQYIQEHLNAVTYEVRINGELLSNWRQFGTPVRDVGGSFAKYWFVPYGPLAAGEYTITYRATWSEQIYDGYAFFGPGTTNPVEEGACTFRVN